VIFQYRRAGLQKKQVGPDLKKQGREKIQSAPGVIVTVVVTKEESIFKHHMKGKTGRIWMGKLDSQKQPSPGTSNESET